MKINGVDIKYRGGDCLKQSLSFLLNIPLTEIPNFHRFPVSTWRKALETWVKSQNKSLIISNNIHHKPHISIFRLWCKKTNDNMGLHAVVVDQNDNILFDINEGKTQDVSYSPANKRYIIE